MRAEAGGLSGLHVTDHPSRITEFGVVVQLVRIPACHAGGRGFESRPLRQNTGKANASSPFSFVVRVAACAGVAVAHQAYSPIFAVFRARLTHVRFYLQAQEMAADHSAGSDRAALRT